MNRLADKNFETLNKNSQALSRADIMQYLEELNGWQVEKVDNQDQLVKTFSFNNFMEALEFTNRVGSLAEEYNHHPALTTEWGRTEVRWWTHSVGGLHQNDFIMAAKTDKL